MQVLKVDVKNKIIEAAVEEFLINGYEKSSLRTIASQAGITIGNIYSYFSSKDDLFSYIVSPAAEALDTLLSFDFVKHEGSNAVNLAGIAQKICDVFISNKERFFILINNSTGSKYENSKDTVVAFISKRFKSELFPSLKKPDIDPLFAEVLATSLLSGFLTIFNQFGGDEARLSQLIKDLLDVFLAEIS